MKNAARITPFAPGKKTPDLLKQAVKWGQVNSVVLVNAGSLVGTTAVTSMLGFVYWWFAARQFPPEAVGLASAAISAMTLLGTFAILGLGTLLLGELPRQRSRAASLICAALILVGGVGGLLGLAFALAAPRFSTGLRDLGASIENSALFALGAGLTAITLVLDDAFIGLLRGGLQLWRNAIFALVKLVALLAASLWLSRVTGLTIYATWSIGNICSLVALAGYALVKKGRAVRGYILPLRPAGRSQDAVRCRSEQEHLPQWGLLRKLGLAALKHHLLNVTLQAPALVLPVLVTMVLSATINAWFYVSWNLSSIANIFSAALTMTLYAASSAQPGTLAHKIRLTLSLAFAVSVLANVVLLFGTGPVLELFGHSYAEQAAWSLRILSLESFPFLIKNHYIAVSRIQGRVAHAAQLTIITSLLEIGGAALGARLGGLTGLSAGWTGAMCLEAIFMSPPVFKAARLSNGKWTPNNQIGNEKDIRCL
jgi:O-antigen/teichoic acid export membrane protein